MEISLLRSALRSERDERRIISFFRILGFWHREAFIEKSYVNQNSFIDILEAAIIDKIDTGEETL